MGPQVPHQRHFPSGQAVCFSSTAVKHATAPKKVCFRRWKLDGYICQALSLSLFDFFCSKLGVASLHGSAAAKGRCFPCHSPGDMAIYVTAEQSANQLNQLPSQKHGRESSDVHSLEQKTPVLSVSFTCPFLSSDHPKFNTRSSNGQRLLHRLLMEFNLTPCSSV